MIAAGGFGYAGQSCISVQRIVVHEKLYDDFRARLIPIHGQGDGAVPYTD